MFKKILLFLSIISFSQFTLLIGFEPYEKHATGQHTNQLDEIVGTIRKLPEAVQLMNTIQAEGPFKIVADYDNPVSREFGACWDCVNRVIIVNPHTSHSKGSLIGSILFEMQNALVNSEIQQYDELASSGQIDKENYVKSMEYLEYQNSLRASEMAEKGIKMGLYPKGAQLPTYTSFDEHYYYQQVSGHSACFANNFDHLQNKI